MRRRYQRPQRPQGQQGSQRPPPNAPPIQRKDGIKARSQRGQFVTNWWAQRWISALERVVNSGRLNRGRTYARAGQVLSLDEVGGVVKARVQGTRPQPYKVTIKLKPLSDRQWDRVIDALSGQALFAAQLLAGEMPQEIDAVFAAAGSSLFPSTEGELETECSCPDWANPCKHVAATHYILAEQLDEDPFLLFRLRGRTQEQVMAALRRAPQRYAARSRGTGPRRGLQLWPAARREPGTLLAYGRWRRGCRNHARPGSYQAAGNAASAVKAPWPAAVPRRKHRAGAGAGIPRHAAGGPGGGV